MLLTGGTKQSNPGPARARPDAETAKVDGRCFGHVDRSGVLDLGWPYFFLIFLAPLRQSQKRRFERWLISQSVITDH